MLAEKNKLGVMSADEPVECPYCKNKRLFYSLDRGEITCIECGSVIVTRKMDRGPDWRSFTTEEMERRRRTGPAHKSTITNPSLISSTLDLSGKDYTGRKLTAKQRFEMYRLKKWQNVSISSSVERNIVTAIEELDRLTNLLGLPSVVKDEALLIYKSATNKGIVKGRSILGVITASLYAACRKLKIPITLDEIVKHTTVNRKDIARYFRILLKEAKIKVSVADPIDYLEKFIELLKLKRFIYSKAKELIKKARDKGITGGKDPAGLAAAAIYIATILENEQITQKEVAKVAGVTEVTVRNRLREMIKKLNISGIDIKLEKEEKPRRSKIKEYVDFYFNRNETSYLV